MSSPSLDIKIEMMADSIREIQDNLGYEHLDFTKKKWFCNRFTGECTNKNTHSGADSFYTKQECKNLCIRSSSGPFQQRNIINLISENLNLKDKKQLKMSSSLTNSTITTIFEDAKELYDNFNFFDLSGNINFIKSIIKLCNKLNTHENSPQELKQIFQAFKYIFIDHMTDFGLSSYIDELLISSECECEGPIPDYRYECPCNKNVFKNQKIWKCTIINLKRILKKTIKSFNIYHNKLLPFKSIKMPFTAFVINSFQKSNLLISEYFSFKPKYIKGAALGLFIMKKNIDGVFNIWRDKGEPSPKYKNDLKTLILKYDVNDDYSY